MCQAKFDLPAHRRDCGGNSLAFMKSLLVIPFFSIAVLLFVKEFPVFPIPENISEIGKLNRRHS